MTSSNTILNKNEWPSFFSDISINLDELQYNLTEKLSSADNLLTDLVKHIFKAGGKRLRPALCFLVAKGTTGISSRHMVLAELTELIHTASLIHDDIIDSANFRRGEKTINNLWNDKLSVIYGDFLFAEASIRLGILEKSEIVKIYAQVLSDLCAGEIDQFARKFDTSISWDYYINKSKSKTASLFAAACKSSAILSELSKEDIYKANQFGEYLGIAFQIVDDVLDFTSTNKEMGKDVCSDMKQGLLTAPVIYALESQNEKAKILKVNIESRFLDEEVFKQSVDLVFELNGIEKAKILANEYIEKAKESLDFIRDKNVSKSMLELCNSVVEKL